jgi:outer membrane protein TolC
MNFLGIGPGEFFFVIILALIVLGPERLPGAIPPFQPRKLTGAADRPDLQTLGARLAQSELKLALAENELKPRLDLRGELAYDVGATGRGGDRTRAARAARRRRRSGACRVCRWRGHGRVRRRRRRRRRR